MKALIFFISIKSFACIDIIENKRFHEMAYNFYANNGADNCIRLPYVRKDFKPQGVYITNQNTVYISAHHKEAKLASRVLQAHGKTGEIVKVYHLMGSEYRGYLGKTEAISLFDKGSKFVVPTQKAFCIFDKKNAKLAADGSYRAHMLGCQEQELEGGTISFITYSFNKKGQKYIWAIVSMKKKNRSKIFGYKVVKNKILKQATHKFNVPKSLSNVESLAVLDSSFKKYSFLLGNSNIHSLKMYDIEFTYDEVNKSYNYNLMVHKNDEGNRSLASIRKLKRKSKGFHKRVSLKEAAPEYLRKNLPALHQGVQAMVKMNLPMMPPK